MRPQPVLWCLLSAALLPAPATAQSNAFGFDWNQVTSYSDNHEAFGNGRAKSFSLFADGTTTFLFYLRNEENSGVVNEVRSTYNFRSKHIYPWDWDPTRIVEFTFDSYSVVGSVNAVNTPLSGRSYAVFSGAEWLPEYDPQYDFIVGFEYDWLAYHPIYGCTLPEFSPDFWYGDGYLQTCTSAGYDGWIRFELRAPGQWTLNDVSSEMIGDVTVTPEPISMLLLGSGLAGIAAARRRRKRPALH